MGISGKLLWMWFCLSNLYITVTNYLTWWQNLSFTLDQFLQAFFLKKFHDSIWWVPHLWAITCQRGTKFSISSPILSDLIKSCSNVPANKKQKWAKFLHLTLNCSWDIGFWNVGNFTAFFSDIYHFEFSISNEIVITWVL